MPDGLVLATFRGLRYDPARVGPLAAVTCPPYDVLDAATAVRLSAHLYSVVRLVLPHVVDPTDPAPHATAAARLAAWRRQGVLRTDRDAGFYVYEETEAGRVHRGLLGALALPTADAGAVLPHEETRAETVADRLALLAATEADLEPILLIPNRAGNAFSIADAVRDERPLAEFRSEDGVDHRVWSLTDGSVTAAVAAALRPARALLADGHHRYEASQRLRQRRAGQHPDRHPADYALALLADPATAPRLNPIHRVVPGLPPRVAADTSRAAFAVEALPPADPGALVERLRRAGRTRRAFVVGDAHTAYLLVGPDPRTLAATVPPNRSPAWRELDVTVAHATLLRALWGVRDDPDHVEVCFTAQDALHRAARIGGSAVLLNPPSLAAITAVAEAGDRMPRKSTFFTPKPRTGLVLRVFADQRPPTDG